MKARSWHWSLLMAALALLITLSSPACVHLPAGGWENYHLSQVIFLDEEDPDLMGKIQQVAGSMGLKVQGEGTQAIQGKVVRTIQLTSGFKRETSAPGEPQMTNVMVMQMDPKQLDVRVMVMGDYSGPGGNAKARQGAQKVFQNFKYGLLQAGLKVR